MSEKDTYQTTWQKKRNKVLATAKWLKRGSMAIVDVKTEPLEIEIEGQYGKRKVFIIGTIDYGLIYVTPVQFVQIAKMVEAAKFKDVTVQL